VPSDIKADRRTFLKTSAIAGTALMASRSAVFADDDNHSIPRGDIDILRLFAALEILETDFWQQYNELGGVQDREVPGGSGNSAYTEALNTLDEDMSIYVHDNTDDEISHFKFINAYLTSKGARPVDLEQFRTLPSSQARGADRNKKRLTNLFQLTVDTSWWTRYRDDAHNPDLDGFGVFPPAVPDLANGQFRAIPKDNSDTQNATHLQAIANTAAFHFASIEQAGSSLYPTLALRVSNPEVLRILLSIGPSETMHFQTWMDKAGNAPPLTDPTNGLTFPDLTQDSVGELFLNNLIMPEPCPFISRKLPRCSVIRPVSTSTHVFGGVVAVEGLIGSGLFTGQSPSFFAFIRDLARKADAARRHCEFDDLPSLPQN
jgi:Ferritin-like domain